MTDLFKNTEKRQTLLRAVMRAGFGFGIAILLLQINLESIESLTYDFRFRLKPVSEPSGHVAPIAIGLDTLESLNRDPNVSDHIQVLKMLIEARPKAVVYVLDPGTLVGTQEELEEFVRVSSFLPFYVAGQNLNIRGIESRNTLPAPLDRLPIVPAPRTVDGRSFAKDNVTRRFIFSFQGRQTLHPILASLINQKETSAEYDGIFDFFDSEQGYIDFRPTGTYSLLQFGDILSKKISAEALENKIVLIGRDNQSTSKDYVQTPFSRDILAMSNLELHANILDTLILNRIYKLSPKWINLVITSSVAILTVFVALLAKPVFGLMALGLTMLTLLIVSYFAFTFFQFSLGVSHSLVAIFISYYFFIPYRLIMENRKSWEYLQRNKLLTQVEEMKSNFLRMMSHDLKTPLARIQGMTEIVLRDVSSLSVAQKEALVNIHQSSEELETFVSSILNYGRIESQDVKLNLKSKDINQLLNQVADRSRYLAQKKNVELILELEPLFSVKMDEDLMRQVLTNLIENAIKYSHDGGKILITSDEVGNRIQVQISDQGLGISKEEIPNLFTKFFRTKNVARSGIKGSGLGLYLSQYFVELHKGKILVESELGKGSTFTVELPLQAEEQTELYI